MEERIKKLAYKRIKMICILSAILFICYFMIPFTITAFPKFMNTTILFEKISIIWLYTFFQIPLTWLLGWIYWHKSKQLDLEVVSLIQEEAS